MKSSRLAGKTTLLARHNEKQQPAGLRVGGTFRQQNSIVNHEEAREGVGQGEGGGPYHCMEHVLLGLTDLFVEHECQFSRVGMVFTWKPRQQGKEGAGLT